MNCNDDFRTVEGFLRSCAEEQTVYGGFHSDDPRDFSPDPECSSPEERETHRLACERAERGEESGVLPQFVIGEDAVAVFEAGEAVSATMVGGAVVTAHRQSFGLGTTTYRDEEAVEALAAFRRMAVAARGCE